MLGRKVPLAREDDSHRRVGTRVPARLAGSWGQPAIDRPARARAESVDAIVQGAPAGRVTAPPPVAGGQLMPGPGGHRAATGRPWATRRLR